MDRLTARSADYTTRPLNRLRDFENLMEQYNILDLPTLETLLKANAEGRVVVLPEKYTVKRVRAMFAISERINGYRVRKGQEPEPTITWQAYDLFAKVFGVDKEAESALEKEKSDAKLL